MAKKYEKTHPWITFSARLENAPAHMWMLLGEAISKCQHISNVPLKPAFATNLNLVYLAKGVHATTAIEGNTLTEKQVQEQAQGTLKLPPSKNYLGKEVENVLEACNGIILRDLSAGNDDRLTVSRVCQFNALVLKGLHLEEGVVPGKIRKHVVGVGRYRGAPPEDCEYLLDKLCDFVEEPQMGSHPLETPAKAILMAILGHLYLAWIHPFGDGNGRTARLIELQLLIRAGVPVPAAHLLSNHYNLTRGDYYRQLDIASKNGGNVIPFLCYALQGFVDGLREQLELIRYHQWDTAWINHVYDTFGSNRTSTDERRLRLVLDLSAVRKPVHAGDLRAITPKVAVLYAEKTRRALTADLKILADLNLVEKVEGGYRAAKAQILALLPRAKTGVIQQATENPPDPKQDTFDVPAVALGEELPDNEEPSGS